MFGWSIRARACRSASNRATTCRVSMPGLMTFRATLRRTGLGLLGHVDDAHAALADLLQQLVRADDRARAARRRPCRRSRRSGPRPAAPGSCRPASWASSSASTSAAQGRRRRRRPRPGSSPARPAAASSRAAWKIGSFARGSAGRHGVVSGGRDALSPQCEKRRRGHPRGNRFGTTAVGFVDELAAEQPGPGVAPRARSAVPRRDAQGLGGLLDATGRRSSGA